MAKKSERFTYTEIGHARKGGVHVPLLPLCLFGSNHPIESTALVDSGSTLNVLPRALGERLGLKWNASVPIGPIGGIFSKTEARAAKIRCQFSGFQSLPLLFAWAENDSVPLILGQVDFFRHFKSASLKANEHLKSLR